MDLNKLTTPKQINDIIFDNSKNASAQDTISKLRHEINNQLTYLVSNNDILVTYLHKVKGYIDVLVEIKECVEHGGSARNLTETLEAADKILKNSSISGVLTDIEEILKDEKKGLSCIKEIIARTKENTESTLNDKQFYNLNTSIMNVVNILKRQISDVKIQTSLSELPEIKMFPSNMERAILNILINSAEAIKAKKINNGKIDIITYLNNEHVCCEIIDNGIGINMNEKDSIFDEYYTTKTEIADKPTKNVGLGLPITKNIIESEHKGKLICESISGICTRFTIRLPVENQYSFEF